MIPIAKVIVSPTEPQGKNRKKVWMQKGKNLFNKDDAIIDGYYIDNSGNLISASNSWYQNAFIKVKSNTQYTMSSGHEILRVCFYDNNKNYISRNTTEKTSLTFLTPSNCEYVKLSGDTSSIQILDLQLEQGPNKTYYEAYIEPKIYIKNINDVYEEFINKKELENKITGLEDNVKDLQTNYNSFLKPMKLGFGGSGELTKTFNLTTRGSAFISVMPNGYSDGTAYIIYFNNKNTLTKVHTLFGDSSVLKFNINNGVLTITCSVQWSDGFIIFNS